MKDLLLMGRIGSPHGIKGEFFADWFGDASLSERNKVYLGTTPEQAINSGPFIITGVRPHKGRYLLTLDGVSERDSASRLTGQNIYFEKSALPPLADDETWLDDLIGYKVFLKNQTEEPKLNKPVGLLDHFEFPADQEIWVIRGENGKEILFPAQPEFIESIDQDKKIIYITPPPGLLDIYDA